jgi:hypothetical protein
MIILLRLKFCINTRSVETFALNTEKIYSWLYSPFHDLACYESTVLEKERLRLNEEMYIC